MCFLMLNALCIEFAAITTIGDSTAGLITALVKEILHVAYQFLIVNQIFHIRCETAQKVAKHFEL